MNINTILMSPPCQPFTRVGKKKDIDDARSNALIHICNVLPELTTIEYILLENVKGFETSQAREIYIESLSSLNFHYQEFLLSPAENIGIPNTRCRYYCLARKSHPFSFKSENILQRLPNCITPQIQTVASALDNIDKDNDDHLSKYLIEDDVLTKRFPLFDVKFPQSTNTNCFTKAYTHYAEGTGSVYCSVDSSQLDDALVLYKDQNFPCEKKLELLKTLKLRYFTPAEVAKLMCFPNSFSFPSEINDKQRYRVLGNSINVAIVSKLIELLCEMEDTL